MYTSIFEKADFPSVFKTKNISVVVNFLCQVIFIFSLFLGTVLYANEFETNEKQKLTEIKNLLQHFHMWCISVET